MKRGEGNSFLSLASSGGGLGDAEAKGPRPIKPMFSKPFAQKKISFVQVSKDI